MTIDLGPRTLAGTDLQVGRVVFGAMTFGSQVDADEAHAMVQRCRESGVTMFDTSNNYNEGASEEILGRCVAPFRDQVQLTTKVGSHVGQSDPERTGLTRKAIRSSLEDSLRRLGTDYVDVYYFHRPDWNVPVEESLAAMDEAVRSGKVRHVGQSNFAAWQVTELNYLAQQHGWPPVRVAQVQYNLISRRIEAEYVACSQRLGLTNIVYNPLAGGLLTGKHRLDAVPADDGSRFTKDMYRERYWNAQTFAAVDELSRIAADAGMSLLELAFRWVLNRPVTDCLLLGASRLQQLEDNLAAMRGPAPDEETMNRCDQVWAGLAGAAPHYNR